MSSSKRIDSHVHVGVIGTTWPRCGKLSDWYRQTLGYRVFLMYAHVDPDNVSDETLHAATLRTVRECGLDQVVALALDPVYDSETGARDETRSHMWVSNDYVVELAADQSGKFLFGCSVHPYDPRFVERVRTCVDRGAVLIKWLPSAQQIDLADKRVLAALEFLATAKNGRPLPLLLHVGHEYAIPTSDPRTTSWDYLTWGWRDRLANAFRRKAERWHTPKLDALHRNLEGGLAAGAVIIFAHAGTPYFTSGMMSTIFGEHSDFDRVRQYVAGNDNRPGKAYIDVSAFCTPFRAAFFDDIEKIDPRWVLYGSDFPTPAFELSAGADEHEEDFKAVIRGELERVIIPEDNLLDVNFRELSLAFPGHPMFGNFEGLM